MKGSIKYNSKLITQNRGIQTLAKRPHERWNKISEEGNFLRNKRSVWYVNTIPNDEEHFAVFPPALITPMIKAGCPKDGIVMDCFAGTNTTGIVARKLGRNFISIELSGKYVEIAKLRTKKKMGIFL